MGAIGDLLRKVVSFVLFVAAVIALIGAFIGGGTILIDPFKEAFDPFNFGKLGAALYAFIEALSVPLILGMLGLIGLTLDDTAK